jgi:hypothetical protein
MLAVVESEAGARQTGDRTVSQPLPQAGQQPAVFHNPGQRAGTGIAGGKLDAATGIAADIHAGNGADAGHVRPGLQLFQKTAVERADGVNAGIPALLQIFKARLTFQQGNLAPAIGQRQCQAGTHQATTDNDDVVLCHGLLS